jgi:hypothetical protein
MITFSNRHLVYDDSSAGALLQLGIERKNIFFFRVDIDVISTWSGDCVTFLELIENKSLFTVWTAQTFQWQMFQAYVLSKLKIYNPTLANVSLCYSNKIEHALSRPRTVAESRTTYILENFNEYPVDIGSTNQLESVYYYWQKVQRNPKENIVFSDTSAINDVSAKKCLECINEVYHLKDGLSDLDRKILEMINFELIKSNSKNERLFLRPLIGAILGELGSTFFYPRDQWVYERITNMCLDADVGFNVEKNNENPYRDTGITEPACADQRLFSDEFIVRV